MNLGLVMVMELNIFFLDILVMILLVTLRGLRKLVFLVFVSVEKICIVLLFWKLFSEVLVYFVIFIGLL